MKRQELCSSIVDCLTHPHLGYTPEPQAGRRQEKSSGSTKKTNILKETGRPCSPLLQIRLENDAAASRSADGGLCLWASSGHSAVGDPSELAPSFKALATYQAASGASSTNQLRREQLLSRYDQETANPAIQTSDILIDFANAPLHHPPRVGANFWTASACSEACPGRESVHEGNRSTQSM